MGGTAIQQRIERAAEAALADQRYVSAIDVLLGLRWLVPPHLDEWRQGRAEYLEQVMQVGLPKLWDAMGRFHAWAQQRGLVPSETEYVARTRDRRPLRFSLSGDPEIERAYRTHWVSPELSAAARERLTERQSRPPDPPRHLTTEGLDMRDLLRQHRGFVDHAGCGSSVCAVRKHGSSGFPACWRCRTHPSR